MEHIFPAAMEHIRLMENRIAQQQAAIQRLQQAGQDISEGVSRLKLLHAALEERRASCCTHVGAASCQPQS
jgi:hypothetical protein